MKILRTDEYIDLVAKLEMYKELLRVERMLTEKRKKQIEKMKCCGNCKDELKQYDRGGCPDCIDLSKWELAK